MKLWIVSVGNKMPGWVSEGFAEYVKRMPREARIELLEVKPEKRGGGKTTAQIMEAERDRILPALPQGCLLVALDEHGEQFTTHQLASAVEGWMRDGRDVAFVIGGADGLHPEVKKRAARMLALSSMTMPHALVRVILAEQLYRALSVIQNHPYHRE